MVYFTDSKEWKIGDEVNIYKAEFKDQKPFVDKKGIITQIDESYVEDWQSPTLWLCVRPEGRKRGIWFAESCLLEG